MAATVLGTVLHRLRCSLLRQEEADLTDGELLERFISQRNEAAFEALLRRHGAMVLGVCRRILRNEADAEDAFQAAFLVLVRKAAAIRPRGMVGNWLYGVAHSTALKARAMKTKRLTKERQALPRPMPDVSAETEEQLQALLDQELKALPDVYRAAIVLCDLEGKSIKEAARQLGCPLGTVGARLTRGRALLRKRLSKHGPPLSSGLLLAVLSQGAASAAVPPALALSTAQAANGFAAGQATTAVTSAKVAALTEGVLKTMLLSKLRIGIGSAMLVVFAAVAIATCGLRSLPLRAEPPAGRKDEPQRPKPFAVAGHVCSLAWGRDGLATIAYQEPNEKKVYLGNSTVQFWDAHTGQEKRTLGEEANTELSHLAYSPDGKVLALSSYKRDGERRVFEVRLCDAAKGELLREFESHDISYGSLAFSPDGKTLATAGTKFEPFKGEFERIVGEVKLWDVTTGKMKQLLQDKRELDFFHQFNALAFSPDGKTLATPGIRFEYTPDMVPAEPDLKNPIGSTPRSHYEVILWNLDTGKVKRVLKGESHWFSVAFSPDGKFLVAADHRGDVRIWEMATGKLERTLSHDRAGSCRAVLSPDGKWLATVGGQIKDGQWEGSVKLWDFRAGDEKQTLPELKGSAIVFSPDSKRLAVGDGSTVRIWDIQKAAFQK
jgi:RNA polymerase sigma factor (sigma-70 family)